MNFISNKIGYNSFKKFGIFKLDESIKLMATFFVVDLSLLFFIIRIPIEEMTAPVIKLDLFVVSKLKYI